MSPAKLFFVALTCLALTGCLGPEPGTESLSVGSLAAFEAEVQPHLTSRCASGGCHGRADRPFSLFAPGFQRIDPARTYLDEPLDEEETAWNAARVAAFAAGSEDPNQSLVVCKPLSSASGGCYHGGGEVFTDTSDPGCRALGRWLTYRAESPSP